MNMLRTNLNSIVGDFESHWNNILNKFFHPDSLGDLKNRLKNSGYPKVDTFSAGDKYLIQATVPGVKPEDLTVEIFEDGGNRFVRMTGQMSEEYKVDEADWEHRELHRRSFSRVVPLPSYIEGDPDAKIKDGIVSLVWQDEREKPKPVKKIELKKE